MQKRKTILIAHRGNLYGPNSEQENSPTQINIAIILGFDVEVDLRYIDNKFWLGHSEPEYFIDFKWLRMNSKKLWVHAKDLATLIKLQDLKFLNYFYQTGQGTVLTSKKFIWTTNYPSSKTIYMKQDAETKIKNVLGICSDHVNRIRRCND